MAFRTLIGMVGRPQLGIGTAGQVRIYAQRDGYRAITTFRDFDGRSYQIQRHRKTKGAAQRALAEALRDRGWQAKNSTLTAETKVSSRRDLVGNRRSEPTLPRHPPALSRSARPPGHPVVGQSAAPRTDSRGHRPPPEVSHCHQRRSRGQGREISAQRYVHVGLYPRRPTAQSRQGCQPGVEQNQKEVPIADHHG